MLWLDYIYLHFFSLNCGDPLFCQDRKVIDFLGKLFGEPVTTFVAGREQKVYCIVSFLHLQQISEPAPNNTKLEGIENIVKMRPASF